MDRQRIIRQIANRGILVSGVRLQVEKELGRGGNGVAFLCRRMNRETVVAKVYIPPDRRDLDDRALQRFRLEIKLSSKYKHPYVIKALGSGSLQVGAYSLPFYLMPYAAQTLRQYVPTDAEPEALEKRLRLFLKAALGVCFLHSEGVIHRDLKPENILISKEGSPWVADLGIAHVNPNFVSGTLRTIKGERLLNRDYYAPEQRFGSAEKVDHRADIYALGCILYELICGTPPVRHKSPPLITINEAFAPFDPIVDRMMAYSAKDRFQRMEDVIEELSVVIGWVLATTKGVRTPTRYDPASMIKLLKSSNEANRRRGLEIARALGADALELLHELLGHSRRDVRNTVALALGEITHPTSIPFLIAGLYGNTTRASMFRPSADTAADALTAC